MDEAVTWLMTLDELIVQLAKLKSRHGGSIQVMVTDHHIRVLEAKLGCDYILKRDLVILEVRYE